MFVCPAEQRAGWPIQIVCQSSDLLGIGFCFSVCFAITISQITFEIIHFGNWRESSKDSYSTPDKFSPPAVSLCANIMDLIIDPKMKADCTSTDPEVWESCFDKLKSYPIRELLEGNITTRFQDLLGKVQFLAPEHNFHAGASFLLVETADEVKFTEISPVQLFFDLLISMESVLGWWLGCLR